MSQAVGPKAQQLLLRWFAAPKKGAKKPLAIKDAEQPSSSKKLAIQDVEQPSSSKTLVSKDVAQPATEDVENSPEPAALPLPMSAHPVPPAPRPAAVLFL